ncbi:hypothetical protein [Lacisediminihabitans changchengi]|uniref:HIRAN domain-containing protein n=1 Tax=Lacisediminihabitans changchengi TaxID=2787634 RepID=A0A934W551_9MICO|nr:hypothetical protein [Lacisediminihabitans changchengi]MBK4348964.1 hypothetical protein [Lacisediminihabitans changchengi]
MPSVLEAPVADVVTETELLVIWQQPSTRAMVPVGILTFDGETYAFNYLPNVAHVAEFRPLLGFRDLAETYKSDELFPLFRERVLDPTRPDFVRVLDELSLDPAATPWEQLVRSGGSSEGDTLQVTPFPRESAEGWTCTALVAGVRYLAKKTVETTDGWTRQYSDVELEALLGGLAPGQSLRVIAEVGNDYNADAQLFFTEHDEPVGYLPDWLAKLTAPCLHDGTSVRVVVDRVNGVNAGWHLRVLVTLHVGESFADLQSRLEVATRSY